MQDATVSMSTTSFNATLSLLFRQCKLTVRSLFIAPDVTALQVVFSFHLSSSRCFPSIWFYRGLVRGLNIQHVRRKFNKRKSAQQGQCANHAPHHSPSCCQASSWTTMYPTMWCSSTISFGNICHGQGQSATGLLDTVRWRRWKGCLPMVLWLMLTCTFVQNTWLSDANCVCDA